MSDLSTIKKGKLFEVCTPIGLKKTFDQLEVRQKARLNRLIESYAENGHRYLDEEKFKAEGRFPSGKADGATYMVYAFKAWKVRLYGCISGNRFIITEIDTDKKQNKANPQKIKNAAKRFTNYAS